MRITLQANPANAPGCVLLVANDGQDLLIQADLDFPGIAETFGWSPADVRTPGDCQHDGTDGTIACPECALSAWEFIRSAREWLDEHDGATVDDPGYFGGN